MGTYLQESLGFLSQQQPSGGWPTGAPAGAGAGKSLGMAFLSGVCAPGGWSVFVGLWRPNPLRDPRGYSISEISDRTRDSMFIDEL